MISVRLAFCFAASKRGFFQMSATKSYYNRDDEIEAVVRGFESCATKPAAFDHCAHLTVAFSYLHLSHLSVAQARERMALIAGNITRRSRSSGLSWFVISLTG